MDECTACGSGGMKVQYVCISGRDDCRRIEFDEVPSAVPHCCGLPMKRLR